MKRKRNPSKGAVSAASVKGNAGPGEQQEKNKVNSQNNQYKK
ncbi:YuzL family protein [Peribacillus psychrosaccharolyticus]|uniref:YuzL family protein n=1 Tax=Peribacillus psychrosaccharolyticus TaxID=1407 RepID=A0A974NKA9_PERPY|nr:YuzL family protein [Peribacillus psychrosaccharolyticus]MEC2055616.1 YuzL family protein [Peribacillus psychrosaccharolyticus]MED3743357.1 YuzL family protein [Peribacillus psychrosaccharolyticus]QQS99278.1 YuzL family protein [Peribacillus psychrosaccharolyticus]